VLPGVTQGVTELVAVSQAGDAIVAYSTHTGRWHKQAIPGGHEKVPYTVGSGMVAVRIENTLYYGHGNTGPCVRVPIA
jgi:hypothetical protein